MIRGRAAPPGILILEVHGIEPALLHPDLLPIDVQLFRDQHRQHRLDALPDLGILPHDRHHAVRHDLDPGVEQSVGSPSGARSPTDRSQRAAEQDPATRDRGDPQELASVEGRGHGFTPMVAGSSAAR
jgi:hypothetical protein